MAAHPPRRTVISVLVSVPASGSLGGGLAAVGHGSELTLLIVTIGPTAICALLCCLLVRLYLMEKQRYLAADQRGRQAIREFDATLVDLVVSLLTRTRTVGDGRPGGALPSPQRGRTAVPGPRRPGRKEAGDRGQPG